MEPNFLKKIIPGFLAFFLPLAQGAYGLDSRNTPIEVFLIMDGSSAMKNAGDEAVEWVCSSLVDGILQDGDRITLWNAGGTAQIVYSETIAGAAGKEAVKNTLRSLSAGANQADFAGALRDASQRAAASRSAMAYTLLISGSSAALSPALLGSGAGLLRYSRIEEFSGWRALVIALGINSRVGQAASAWIAGS
jgi:hypothetical protein